ncbi:unnamed protein product [Parascedosporium putredinis]|uniref:Ankyrin n=1 Tax=Parascedosporium putredinis TaxID=1442378 RepID=A0A9P1MCC3_9PEZI|nr:unnamed protein product [Parascedosporium putredinis]CAI8001315.1 unnamed protein product [Parascedosporium putredinis]
MDLGALDGGGDGGGKKSVTLPDDLPKSLNDRRIVRTELMPETEMYDGWQGQSQFLTSPMLAKPLDFGDLSLDDRNYIDDDLRSPISNEARLMEMLAAQAAHSADPGFGDEDTIAADEKARDFVDINGPDEDGTPALIYASCFGHESVVQALVDAGADVDKQDRNQWTALMWAMTNRHKSIAKMLLDHGASAEQKTSTGRTAIDFVPLIAICPTIFTIAGITSEPLA